MCCSTRNCTPGTAAIRGRRVYVDATEPRWSAAPVQAVSNAAPAPVVECIAFAAVVYAAQAIEVEWIDMYVAIPEFLAVVPRSQEWSAEGTAAPAASAAPAPVAPASTVEGVHCHGLRGAPFRTLDGKSRCARYPVRRGDAEAHRW